MSPSDFLSVVTIETNIYASGEAYMYILPNSEFFSFDQTVLLLLVVYLAILIFFVALATATHKSKPDNIDTCNLTKK